MFTHHLIQNTTVDKLLEDCNNLYLQEDTLSFETMRIMSIYIGCLSLITPYNYRCFHVSSVGENDIRLEATRNNKELRIIVKGDSTYYYAEKDGIYHDYDLLPEKIPEAIIELTRVLEWFFTDE